MLRHRLRVLEALLLLAIARVFVARVRFSRWRASLGKVVTGDAHRSARPSTPQMTRATACANAVRRAAKRLPGSVCLPQSMALQWMLQRRDIPTTLLMGAAPQQMRHGGLGDLHAWVEIGGLPLLEAGDEHHFVVLTLQSCSRG